MKLNYEPRRDQIESEVFATGITDYIYRRHSSMMDTLDLGMGQGHLVKMLRESGRNALGVDVRDMDQEGLILADARNLPFKDESFDLVTEVYLLADMDDFQDLPMTEMEMVVQEAKRILRPDGLFITLPSPDIACPFFDKVLYKDNGMGYGFYQK